jgi:hypothetical protein
MNLTVVSSHNNGRDVGDRQYHSCLCEIGCALVGVVPGTPLGQIGRTLIRFGWTALGADQRIFTKGCVKAELCDKAPGASAAADTGSHDLKVLVALPSPPPAMLSAGASFFHREYIHRTGFHWQLAQLAERSSTPALVVKPVAGPLEVLRTMETERVHGMYRITYSTQDLIKDIGAYIKGKVLDAITPEEVSNILEARDILNDPSSILFSHIPVHPHVSRAVGSYVVATEDMGDRTVLLGSFKHERCKNIIPTGSPKSFLTTNKTVEIVYSNSVIYVYGNAAQVKQYGPVFNEATYKLIWKANADIYSKAIYNPNYVPRN